MENEEHIFSFIPGGTAMKCSCGKTFATTDEQQQHVNWHLKLNEAFNAGIEAALGALGEKDAVPPKGTMQDSQATTFNAGFSYGYNAYADQAKSAIEGLKK